MQSTKKAPARREDGVAPSNEESASTGSPAAQQNPLQQVITTDEGKNTKYKMCYAQIYEYWQFVFLLCFV